MLPTLLLSFALVVSVSCGKIPNLEWPEKYFFEITKYNIESGLTQDIKYWQSGKQVRLEYNHGAVKTVYSKPEKSRRGYIYEIHPETDKEGNNKVVCHKARQNRWTPAPKNILPSTDDFQNLGDDMMKDRKCTKFFKEESGDSSKFIESKITLWAYFDHSANAWVPVRYQLEESNSFLGYVDRRDIWDFEGFTQDFDDKTVFDVSEICKSEETVEHNQNDESVTKHLMFIDPENEHHVKHVFEAFKAKFEKKYADEKEHVLRQKIFQRNLRLISSTNRKNLGYKLAVNRFSDRTPQEMKRYTGLWKRPHGKVGTHAFPYTGERLEKEVSKVPPSYDLRLEGVISPVQNQESCGSCWTFGTTSAVEGAVARNNGGKLIRLSNQALIDCAWEFDAGGCDGGTDNAAYEWMIKYGLPTIADYGTYQNQDGYCHIQNVTRTFKIKGYVDVTPESVNALKVALINHGPLSVSVNANEAFVQYSGGVFYDFDCNPSSLNHEITLVGYGEEFGETFWIVKNSWGPDWGIDGFMHIAAKDNTCGIMTEPTYVLL